MPVGIHQATLGEVIEHFGVGTLQRQLVARRLERIYNLAKSSGHIARFIVFGSFVTAKASPNDVDVFILMDDEFDITKITSSAATIFHNRAAQNWLGASIFWIRRMAAVGGEDAVVEGRQIKRDGSRRGIVEVVSNDQER